MQENKQLNLDFQLSSFCEAKQFLDDSRNGYYALCTQQAHSRWANKMMPLHTLPYVLAQQSKPFEQFGNATGKSDVYISQAAFTGWTNKQGNTVAFRRKVSLASIGTLFVDFDYYNDERLKHLKPNKIKDLILKKCIEKQIQLPSIIIDSGRGLQAKWHHCQLPRQALPRWDACELHLINIFSDLSADSVVKDSTRVLRVLNTVNQKNGRVVQSIFTNLDDNKQISNYKFNDLCASILPYTKEDIADFKKNSKKTDTIQKSAVVNFHCAKGHSPRTLNWSRLNDLQAIHKMRNLDMGDGLREPMAFYQANFYALTHQKQHKDHNQYHELLRLVKNTHPNIAHSKAVEKAGRFHKLMGKAATGETIVYNGVKHSPLYTPRNDTLINLFNITSEEQTHLSTIIDSSEKQKRNTQAKRAERQNKGSLTRAEFLTNSLTKTKPWEKLGMSRAAWYRKGKPTSETGVSS
jgi:hypothetical protein